MRCRLSSSWLISNIGGISIFFLKWSNSITLNGILRLKWNIVMMTLISYWLHFGIILSLTSLYVSLSNIFFTSVSTHIITWIDVSWYLYLCITFRLIVIVFNSLFIERILICFHILWYFWFSIVMIVLFWMNISHLFPIIDCSFPFW